MALDSSVKLLIFRISDGALLQVVSIKDGWSLACAWSHDGQTVFVGGEHLHSASFDSATFHNTPGASRSVVADQLYLMGGHVACLAPHPDETVVGCNLSNHSGALIFWRRDTAEPTVIEHSIINAIAFTPDYTAFVSCGWHLELWDYATRTVTRVMLGHEAEIYDVAVTADGRYALSAAEDATIRVWALTGAEKEVKELSQVKLDEPLLPKSVATSPDGKYVFSACYNFKAGRHADKGSVEAWRVEDGTYVGKVLTCKGQAACVRTHGALPPPPDASSAGQEPFGLYFSSWDWFVQGVQIST